MQAKTSATGVTDEDEVPQGIIKVNWVDKHKSEVPSVVVMFFDLEWQADDWSAREVRLCCCAMLSGWLVGCACVCVRVCVPMDSCVCAALAHVCAYARNCAQCVRVRGDARARVCACAHMRRCTCFVYRQQARADSATSLYVHYCRLRAQSLSMEFGMLPMVGTRVWWPCCFKPTLCLTEILWWRSVR